MRLHHCFYGLLMSLCSTMLQAENLLQVYEIAVLRDPALAAAYASMRANHQSLPEAIALMAPNIYGSYQTTGTDAAANYFSPLVESGGYNTKNYSLNLNQPIYHAELWAQLEQARHIVKGADAAYFSATQALIVRVAEHYFNILIALDDLDFTAGQRKAFAREFEQAKQRFEVGLIAITDVETAKARFDNAVAAEISAQNNVFDQYEKLRQITGQPINAITLFPVNKPLPLLPPTPNAPEEWVQTAHLQNMDVIAAKENAEQLKAAIGIQVAGHFPKVDILASVDRQVQQPPFNDLLFSRSITLNVSMPLFSGGSVFFRTREATERYDEAMQKLEGQRRLTDSLTRQAYRGVLTAMSSVEALAQAVLSNESSLRATKAAYEVGTRTIVDVLNAETSLLDAKRTHAKARYKYLLEGLKLKQAAGILAPEDVLAVNNLIEGCA